MEVVKENSKRRIFFVFISQVACYNVIMEKRQRILEEKQKLAEAVIKKKKECLKYELIYSFRSLELAHLLKAKGHYHTF